MSIIAQDNLPHTATIELLAHVQDETWGGVSEDYSEVATEKKCWAMLASSREIEEFQKRDIQITHKIYFIDSWPLAAAEASAKHAIKITAGPSLVGVRMRFRSTADRGAGLGKILVVFAEELRNNKRIP